MEIKNRLFSYPVLCMENDDYTDCEFNVLVTMTEELNDIVLDFEVQIDNEEMELLVREGFAEYTIHIECSNTAYRTIVTMTGNRKKFRILKSRVNNEIALLGMVVATNKIENFTSQHLNEDYRDEKIVFEKGSILAYRNLPRIYVAKNYEELAGENPLFTIVKRIKQKDEEVQPVTYELGNEKIRIMVDEDTYNIYIKFHQNANMQPLVNSLLVMPAMAYMIEVLKISDENTYYNTFWYQQIKKFCKAQGKEFKEDVIDSDKTSIEISQEMLRLPIGRAFKSISDIVDEG